MDVQSVRNGISKSNQEGFIIDLLDEVSKMLRFKYSLHLVKDGEYGHRQSDGTWDGMIGELQTRVIT